MRPTGDLDSAARLRSVGLRVTRSRVAVLSALRAEPRAPVDVIATAVRRETGGASVQAVHDVLRVLGSRGLVRRVDLAGAAARYELRVAGNHHRIVCRSCGTTADVDRAAPCLDPARSHGFVVDEAEVTYRGYCPDCVAPGEPTPGPDAVRRDSAPPPAGW